MELFLKILLLIGIAATASGQNREKIVDRIPPTLGSEAPAALQNDAVKSKIARHCQSQWPDDFAMQFYCRERQTEAARKLGY